jgi:hypothetical protein
MIKERIKRLQQLMTRIAPVPKEWIEAEQGSSGSDRIEPIRCRGGDELEGEGRTALRWRQGLSDVFSTMLSVAASTSQTGNQLCLMVIGDAGSGKSELCDAMLVSRNCYQLEHTTGFHSGFKGEDGKDCSLLSRINHKTLITSEGDVLMSSPYFMELMSQMRRIFDGTSTASYKNSDEDKQWNGLRTPWIIGGTPALMDNDQSRLGDRFLRIHLDQPAIDERRAIVMAAMRAEREAVRETSNGQAGGKESRVRRAYALTGGYIDWLRENVADRVSGVDVSEAAEWHLHDLAEFVADMRARPNADLRKQDTHDTKEMPTRIGRQLTRLALCSAVVLGRPSVDGEVLRRAKRVALDSSKGRSMDAARWFMCIDKRTGRTYQQSDGIMLSELARWQGITEDKMQHYLSFLSKIGVMEHRSAQHSHGHWKLTPRMEQLWINVCS